MLKRNLVLITLWFLIDLNQFILAFHGHYMNDLLYKDNEKIRFGPLSSKHVCLNHYGDIECCEGYTGSFREDEGCKPLCSDGCVHGKCESPNKCECVINFGGSNCNRTCSPGTFGLDCEKDCEYLTDPKRNTNYAHCECKSNEPTSECKDICKCRTNLCSVGFIGKKCEIPCPDGLFGQHCSKNCTCIKENTSKCNPESGDCICKNDDKNRYYGLNCEFKCDGILNCSTNLKHNCTCELTLEQKVNNLIKNQTLQEQNSKEVQLLKKRINDLTLILMYLIIVIPISFLIYKLRNQNFIKLSNFITIGYSNRTNQVYPTNTSYSISGSKSKLDFNNSQFESHIIIPDSSRGLISDSSSSEIEEMFTRNELKK